MKNLKFLPLVCAFLVCATVAASAGNDGKVLLIVETDMGNDIDDAIALDVLYKYADAGMVNIVAIGNHKYSPTATAYIDIMNCWYGYPNIPMAQSNTPVINIAAPDYTLPVVYSEVYPRHKYLPKLSTQVELYRRILAKADDNSIVVLSLGFATELAKLLDSPADDISPLTGRELVARKVKMLSVMAGSYGPKKRAEYNVKNDIPAMQKVFAEWDTPIVQNPFELGKQVMFPGTAISEGLAWAEHHPLADGFVNYHAMPYDRPTWDVLSAIYIFYPEMFTGEKGTVTVDDKGYTNFEPSSSGKHIVLSPLTDAQASALLDHMLKTVAEHPKKRR